MDKRKLSIGLAAALSLTAISVPAYAKVEGDALNAIISEYGNYVAEDGVCKANVPGTDGKQWINITEDVSKALTNGYSLINAEAEKEESTEESVNKAKDGAQAAFLAAMRAYASEKLDTFNLSEEDKELYRKGIEDGEFENSDGARAALINAYAKAYEKNETIIGALTEIRDEWSAFIEETELGHIVVPGSEMKYSAVPSIYVALTKGYTDIWAATSSEDGKTALENAKTNLLTVVKDYVNYLLDTAKDIHINGTSYYIPGEAYNTAKKAIENAETIGAVLAAYDAALDAQVTYEYNAQEYADEWSAFIEETNLGRTLVPGSEMNYSEVPEINAAMAKGYTDIWNTKTNTEGAKAVDGSIANLTAAVKAYVNYLLDTAKDITVNDVTYVIPEEAYNTAKEAIENAETIGAVLAAYDAALEAQVIIVKVTGISVTPSSISLKASSKTTLKAVITPNNASDQSVTWSSDNSSVASINEKGTVEAHKAGNATITATSVDGGFTAKCVVTVKGKADNGGTVSGGGGGGGGAARPTTPVTPATPSTSGTVIGADKSAAESSKEANASAENTAKNDSSLKLANPNGTKVTGTDFKEPAILKIPVETGEATNVNNLTIAKLNPTTGKLEIVGGNYDAKEKSVIGYVTEPGDYFVVEKNNLTTIILQIGNSKAALNNAAKTLDAAPIISQDRTMVPLRFISEAFGAQVDWIDSTKTVIITMGDQVITMQIGQELEGFGAAPIIENGRTMVPISYISAQFGAKVIWVPSTKTVTIAK